MADMPTHHHVTKEGQDYTLFSIHCELDRRQRGLSGRPVQAVPTSAAHHGPHNAEPTVSAHGPFVLAD